MVRLTEKSKTGLWHLRGVSWEQLRTGHKITKTVNEKIYGALCKLKDYEDSGMNPDQAAEEMSCKRKRNLQIAKKCGKVQRRLSAGITGRMGPGET